VVRTAVRNDVEVDPIASLAKEVEHELEVCSAHVCDLDSPTVVRTPLQFPQSTQEVVDCRDDAAEVAEPTNVSL
jgi:hypothetical protein